MCCIIGVNIVFVCVCLRQDQPGSAMNSRKMLAISCAKEERIHIMPAEHDRRFSILFARFVLLRL